MRFAVAALVGLLALAPARAVADGGELDGRYSRDGWATAFFPGWRLGVEIADLAVSPDGGAVVTTLMVDRKGSSRKDPAVAAFDPDGSPDRRFSRDGKLILPTEGRDGEINVAVQGDGKILVVRDAASAGARMVRLRKSGKVDRSFGPNGEVFLGLRDVTDLVVERSGGILLAGSTPPSPAGDVDFAVTRLLESGVQDQSFGTYGTATVDFHIEGEPNASLDFAKAMALRPDGGLVLCGRSSSQREYDTRDGITLAALDEDGRLDPVFSDDGRAFADAEAGTGVPDRGSGGGEDVAVGSHGSVVFGGTAHRDFTASVYTQFGRPDSLFADDGTAVIDASERDDADALAVAPDGGVYLVGSVRGRGRRDYAVLRVTSGGVPDFAFGDRGVVQLDYDGGWDDADAIDLRPNGKLLVSGTIGNDGLGLIRLQGR